MWSTHNANLVVNTDADQAIVASSPAHGCPQNFDAEALQCRVQARGEDSITIVDDVAIRMIERQELAELLCGPLCGWVLSDVAVQDPA